MSREVDPLYRNVPLDLERTLPVLGVPVRYRTHSRDVLEAVDEAFGDWDGLRHEAPERIGAEGIEVRLVVHDTSEGAARPVPIRYRVPDPSRLLISTPGSVALADASTEDATAYVSEEFVADREHFRYGLLESLTLFLVTVRGRTPVHAAAVVRDGAALLLVARSGAGKSSLTYAAARAGFEVLTDDVVFVQTRPRLTIWGMPRYLHLPVEAAARHFPELAGRKPRVRANATEKIAIRLADELDAATDRPFVDAAGIVLLGRRPGGTVGVRPCEAEELVGELVRMREPGFDLFVDEMEEPIRELCRYGGWRLELGDDPRAAVPILEELAAEVGRVPT